jgi:hypothetical protein
VTKITRLFSIALLLTLLAACAVPPPSDEVLRSFIE